MANPKKKKKKKKTLLYPEASNNHFHAKCAISFKKVVVLHKLSFFLSKVLIKVHLFAAFSSIEMPMSMPLSNCYKLSKNKKRDQKVIHFYVCFIK